MRAEGSGSAWTIAEGGLVDHVAERRLRAMVDELPEVDADGGPPDAETVANATTVWVSETGTRRGVP